MSGVFEIARRRPVLFYFTLTFAWSWLLFLAIGGSDLLSGEDWDTSGTFPLAVIAMLTGPTVAGLLLTGVLSGREGFHELRNRLTKWRVAARWYAVALLVAPLLSTLVLLALWPASSSFQPPVFSDERSGMAFLAAIGIGFTTLLEELGWTGFALPRLRRRYSVVLSGVIIGVPWGVWHALQVFWVGWSTAEDVPLALYLTLYLGFGIASLTAFRVLMVGVYERTGSIFVVTLMHASYAGSTLQIGLLLPDLTGGNLLIQGWVLATVLWLVVAVAGLANRGRFPRLHVSGPTSPLPQG